MYVAAVGGTISCPEIFLFCKQNRVRIFSSGRVVRRNKQLKISGILKRVWLVEPCAALPETETGTATRKPLLRRSSIILPPGRRWKLRGMEWIKSSPCSVEPSSCPPQLPSCVCTAGMGIWMGKANWWMTLMTVPLHQSCCQSQKSPSLVSQLAPQARKDRL